MLLLLLLESVPHQLHHLLRRGAILTPRVHLQVRNWRCHDRAHLRGRRSADQPPLRRWITQQWHMYQRVPDKRLEDSRDRDVVWVRGIYPHDARSGSHRNLVRFELALELRLDTENVRSGPTCRHSRQEHRRYVGLALLGRVSKPSDLQMSTPVEIRECSPMLASSNCGAFDVGTYASKNIISCVFCAPSPPPWPTACIATREPTAALKADCCSVVHVPSLRVRAMLGASSTWMAAHVAMRVSNDVHCCCCKAAMLL
jgi:hypothetical protein